MRGKTHASDRAALQQGGRLSTVVQLLGGLSVTEPGGRKARVRLDKKERALFAFLLLRHDRAVGRGELIETFWPERDGDIGCRCLNTTLWRLRRDLAGLPDLELRTTRGVGIALALAPALSVDLWQFRRLANGVINSSTYRERALLAEADLVRLKSAVGLYAGPLLPGLEGGWIDRERQIADDECFQCLRLLGRHFEHSHEPEHALAFYQRALEIDPANEEIHFSMISIFEGLGQRSRALRQYSTCVSALRDCLGVGVMEETSRLAAHIARGSAATHDRTVARPDSQRTLELACAQLPMVFAQMRNATTTLGVILRTLQDSGAIASLTTQQQHPGEPDLDC